MNYPVWDVSWFGAGIPVALIATFHMFITHFAVGAGLFLVLSETFVYRSKDSRIVDYVQSRTRFFLLVTMVLGALSGVGIWLVISVLNPAATSLLIHTFVFAWATEWVFFLVEILSLLIYYYSFGRMEPTKHLTLGWIYFIFAWLSLFMINGIISFMLTPGRWLETLSFWSGLFNPSFLPSLSFRTFLALILAGTYGLITSTRTHDSDLRQKMVRYCVFWLTAPFLLLFPSAWWYLASIPPFAKDMVLGGSPEIPPFANAFLWLTPMMILGGLFLALKLPRLIQQSLALLLLAIAFLYVGTFETVREASRRPFIIYGYMYSNGISRKDVLRVRDRGILRSARWTPIKEISPQNRLQAGREVFKLACVDCHSFAGPRNDIFDRIRSMEPGAFRGVLKQMGKEKGFVPPFPGNDREAAALTEYLFQELRSREN